MSESYRNNVWHSLGRPCGALPDEAEGITEYDAHVNCPGCLEVRRLRESSLDVSIPGAHWSPIITAPKDRPVLGGLLRDNRVWRVNLMRWQKIGWYELNSGTSCHWVTHWLTVPDLGKSEESNGEG